QCSTYERVIVETGHAHVGRPRDGEPVGERDALVHRDELVVAVITARADDEREVDLGGGDAASHRSASASATNSCGSSSSARTSGSSTPRESIPDSSREL